MAHFQGTLESSEKRITLTADKAGGITAHVLSKDGAMWIHAYCNDEGAEYAVVSFSKWQGRGIRKELWRGPIDGSNEKP